MSDERKLEREIKPFGSRSAHIIMPKKFIGHIAIVKILKKIKTEFGKAMSLQGEKHKKGRAKAEKLYKREKRN